MKSFLKTITAFLVTALLLSSSALALYWYDEEFVWTENNKKELLIAKGDSAEFTTGTFVNNEPVYLTIKLIGDDFTKVLVNEEKITFPNHYDVPYKYTIKPSHYNNEAGKYRVTVTLDDKFGVNSAQTHYLDLTVWGGIIVFPPPEPKNNPPVLEPLKDSYTNTEKDGPVSYKLAASDKDGDKITIEAKRYFLLPLFGKVIEFPLSLPEGFYADFGKNVGKFGMVINHDTVQHPKLEEVFLLKFRAFDGKDYSGWQYTKWKIFDVDRAPVLTLEDQQVNEEELFSYKIKAEDKDGDKLTFSAGQLRSPYLPKGAVLFKDTGVFLWTPDNTQAGEYQIVVKVDDGFGRTDKGTFTITVGQKNVPPVMDALQDFSVNEGEIKTLTVKATDVDNNPLTYEAKVKVCKLMLFGKCVSSELVPLSDYYTFDGQTGEFRVAPNYDLIKHPDQEKTGKVVFRAYDGQAYSDWDEVKITFIDVNRFPVALSDSANTLKDTPVMIEVLKNDYDADGDALGVITVTTPDNGYAKVIKWKEVEYTPLNGFTGVDSFDYIIADAYGGKNTASITVTVSEVINHPPVLSPIGNKQAKENEKLSFAVSATDADNDKLTFSAENLPQGAVFDANTQTFTWTPGFNAAENGPYKVTFKVSDGNGGEDSETVTINVEDVIVVINNEPVLNVIGDKNVKEGELLQFLVSATDADNDALTFSVQDLPKGAKFENKVFSWTPTFTQSGAYKVTFKVSDGNGGEDSETVTINVEDVIVVINNEPLINVIGDKNVKEGELLQFLVAATDADNDALIFSVQDLPEGAKFENKVFSWTPTFTQSGAYKVTFKVSDGNGGEDSETITITVEDVIQGITIVSAPITTATEGKLYSYQVTAVSANNNDLVYKLFAAPEGMTISKNGLVEWTPMNSGCGYKVIITVSNGKVTAEQEYSICVVPAYKDLKFASAQIAPEEVSAGEEVQLSVSLKNNGEYEMKDLRITAIVMDLGLEVSSDEFTLKSGKSAGRTLHLQMPYFTEPGQYLIKISVSNSVYHDSVYRLVTIR